MSERLDLPLAEGLLRLRITSATDVGTVRRVNEDSVLVHAPTVAVADGMGGHAFGDRASAAAVDTLRRALPSGRPAPPEQVVAAVAEANRAVRAITADRPGAVAGTTLTGLSFVETGAGEYRWLAFNVGDSRLYRAAAGGIEQVSVDHSVVQELLDAGAIRPADAAGHPDRNIVTRALGGADRVDADVWLLPIARRQRFLLCSDGVTRELADERIARILDAPDAARALVRAAVRNGGGDNVTAIVVDSEIIGWNGLDLEATADRSSRLLEDTLPRT